MRVDRSRSLAEGGNCDRRRAELNQPRYKRIFIKLAVPRPRPGVVAAREARRVSVASVRPSNSAEML